MKTTNTVKDVAGFHFDNPEQILTPENKVVPDTIALLDGELWRLKELA